MRATTYFGMEHLKHLLHQAGCTSLNNRRRAGNEMRADKLKQLPSTVDNGGDDKLQATANVTVSAPTPRLIKSSFLTQ